MLKLTEMILGTYERYGKIYRGDILSFSTFSKCVIVTFFVRLWLVMFIATLDGYKTASLLLSKGSVFIM